MMETIAEFNDNRGLNVKLTKEKIFISATGNEETFALRSVNGVGLYDDLEKYAKEEEEYNAKEKKLKINKISLIVLGVLSLGFGIYMGEFGTFSIIVGIVSIAVSFFLKVKDQKPVLETYFKLMISGAARQFKFHKSDESSVKIADFINKVEDTLTAYSK